MTERANKQAAIRQRIVEVAEAAYEDGEGYAFTDDIGLFNTNSREPLSTVESGIFVILM